MIVNRYSTDNINNLRPGQFAIPNLQWSLNPGGLSEISGEGPRSMITMLLSRGFKRHIVSLIGEKTLQNLPRFKTEAFNELENTILERIEAHLSNIKEGGQISDEEITTIVCGIHIWGGRTGRNLFVMGDKFEGNFSFSDYRRMIAAVLRSDEKEAIHSLEYGRFKQFGTAYATKHLAFWTKSPHVKIQLPVFDSIINQIVFGVSGTPRFVNYSIYLSNMRKAAQYINQINPSFNGQYNVHTLERQIFDWANTEPSICNEWQNIRLNR